MDVSTAHEVAPEGGAFEAGALDAEASEAGGFDDGGSPPSCGDWAGRTPIRALVTGNSQIGWNGLESVVAQLSASAATGCPRIEATHLWGGLNLGVLLDPTTEEGRAFGAALASRAYDVVVLTESHDLVEVEGYVTSFRASALALVEAVRAADAVPVLYATGYVDTPDRRGFSEMLTPQLELGRELGVQVAAGGAAWLRVWRARPDLDLFDPDRVHPGPPGTYLSASVVYAAVTGANPIGLTSDVRMRCGGEECPPVAPEITALLQAEAWAEHLATGR